MLLSGHDCVAWLRVSLGREPDRFALGIKVESTVVVDEGVTT
jgi:hypothetical protein